MMEYNKLVRDRIPEIIRSNGGTPRFHTATNDEYRKKLYEKLLEEVRELIEAPSIEEAADLQEVFLAVSQLEGWSPEDLERVRVGKAVARGAFHDRIILDSDN